MNKKLLLFGLPILALALVSASILIYYGQIQQDVNVIQGLTIDGDDWDVPRLESVTMYSLEEKTIVSAHELRNTATIDATVTLDTSCSAIPLTGGCADITSVTEYVLSASGTKGTESKIHIRAEDTNVDSLNDLISMNWESFIVDEGYIAHVDILIDTTGDGVADDALVIEYDKVTGPSDQLVVNMNFVRDAWTTDAFSDKGSIGDSSIAWLTSEDPGSVGDAGYTAYTLSEWKSGQTSKKHGKVISADVTVIAFQIEVDNWIVDSNGKIRNIQINTVDVDKVTVQAGNQLGFQIVTDFPKMMKPAVYTIITEVLPA